MKDRVNRAANFILKQIGSSIDLAMILGSGYGDFVEELNILKKLYYRDIPGFPQLTITGQKDFLVFTVVENIRLLVFAGRFHYYQGYSLHEVTIPVRVIKKLGGKIVVLTNSAGGINHRYKPGDIMIIRDHINLIGNPLKGEGKEFGEIFIDMSSVYSKNLRQLFKDVSKRLGLKHRVKEGVYIAVEGPSYETPSEIKFFRKVGADAVGMSTVPEAIVSIQEGLDVLAFSLITNMAAGLSKRPLSHEEVIEISKSSRRVVFPMLKELLKELGKRIENG